MSELPEWWTGPYPEVTSVQNATQYIDALGGALSRRQDNGNWVLTTGDQDLIRAGSESELDTFVLGFALAHLIVERHGLIGRRPSGASAAASAPAEVPAEPASLSVVPDAFESADAESSTVTDRDAADDAADDAPGTRDTGDGGGVGGAGGGGGARRRRRR